MSALAAVLITKSAFEIRPYDSSQLAMLGGGTGALLGGAAAGLGTYALSGKSKNRRANALKAALVGALGAGAVGAFAGSAYGADNLKKTWDSVYAPSAGGVDDEGNLPQLHNINRGVKDLYMAARKDLVGTKDRLTPEQFEKLKADTPGKDYWKIIPIPGTVGPLQSPALVHASDAFKNTTLDALKREVSQPPGKFLADLWKGEMPPATSDASNAKIVPEYKWLAGAGPPTQAGVDSLIKQYQP